MYGQESPEWISHLNGEGQGIARDIKKKSFPKFYKKWYQSCDNLQSPDTSLHENIFSKYPQLSPARRRPEFIDESILPNKLKFLDIFNNKKKENRLVGSLQKWCGWWFAMFYYPTFFINQNVLMDLTYMWLLQLKLMNC